MYYERYGLPVTAIRPTLVYGPRSRYGHALYIAGAVLLKWRGILGLHMLAGGPLNHNVHVVDVCRAADHVLRDDAAVGKAFNVADDQPMTLEGFFQAIVEPFGIIFQKRVRYYPWLWRAFVRVLLWLLPLGVKRLNQRIMIGWCHLTETRNLVPALRPKVDRSWLNFVLYDQHYDTSRLRGLGWRPHYPDFRQGIRETIDWYLAHRWIP